MPSATEPTVRRIAEYSNPRRFERWNRKLHYYAGLFLLFFMWLFAFSACSEPSILELCGILEQPQRHEL
jgi:hypothetical protein